jgi:hypothetical protein
MNNVDKKSSLVTIWRTKAHFSLRSTAVGSNHMLTVLPDRLRISPHKSPLVPQIRYMPEMDIFYKDITKIIDADILEISFKKSSLAPEWHNGFIKLSSPRLDALIEELHDAGLKVDNESTPLTRWHRYFPWVYFNEYVMIVFLVCLVLGFLPGMIAKLLSILT